MNSSEISKFRAKSQRFSARCQSQFDNSRKRNDMLRKHIIGIAALFGTIGGIIRNNAVHCSEQKAVLFGIKVDISTEISIDSAEMSKEN